MYFQDALAAVVCYSIDSRHSYKRLKNWIDRVDESREDCIKYVIGNKNDYAEDLRAVKEEEGQTFADKNECTFRETSAKEDLDGINSLFSDLTYDCAELLLRCKLTNKVRPTGMKL